MNPFNHVPWNGSRSTALRTETRGGWTSGNAKGRKRGLRKRMRFLWRVNRGQRPGDDRAMQGGGAGDLGIQREDCICIFLWGLETPSQRTGGISSPLRAIVPKILPTIQQSPPMSERTEKTDALLLTNGIYLRAWSQYVIVNISLLLRELASPSDYQKWACFLSYLDNMINENALLSVLISVMQGMGMKVKAVMWICSISHLYVSRWTIELQSEGLQSQRQQKQCPPQLGCPRNI